jgi:hypothetical protein
MRRGKEEPLALDSRMMIRFRILLAVVARVRWFWHRGITIPLLQTGVHDGMELGMRRDFRNESHPQPRGEGGGGRLGRVIFGRVCVRIMMMLESCAQDVQSHGGPVGRPGDRIGA